MNAAADQPSTTPSEAPAAPLLAVAERVRQIVEALGGTGVRTNGQELSFAAEALGGVEVRLAADLHRPCYDRSSNFAISHGGGPSADPPPAAFHLAIERIKILDDVPIAGVMEVFASAAASLADPLRNDDAGGSRIATGAACPDERWERKLVSQLNVVFLDLCAVLIGGRRGPLSPLHWGFWPAPSAPAANDYDPFEAFSENLIGHLPAHVTRIMDVGCGRGAITRLLAARRKAVTAVSPVAHHCAVIEEARLPGVEVQCARFDDLPLPDPGYDLLLFSESANHFALDAEFFARCKQFLADKGFVLLADDFTLDRIAAIEAQRMFRIVRSSDISENVAPTAGWWAQQLRRLTAFRVALLSILELYDPPVADRVRAILDTLDSAELKLFFSGKTTPPV